MAGSGKTSFTAELVRRLEKERKATYAINLDPAVEGDLPYSCAIDIRDTLDFSKIQESLELGPNGTILTCLNLFVSKFDEVLELLERRRRSLSYIVIDTPGQMEIFSWSASGVIILDTLGAAFPTTVAYVIDTPRSQQPVAFMSNMVYATSMISKSQLPCVLCFNKTDVCEADTVMEWMRDLGKYSEASSLEDSYAASFAKSVAR